jgi:hypothetical protein
MNKTLTTILLTTILLVSSSFLVSANPIDKNNLQEITVLHMVDGSFKVTSHNLDARRNNCYTLSGLKWSGTPISYVINPSNPYGLDESFIKSAITSGVEEWDRFTKINLFNDTPIINYTMTLDYDYPNYQNSYSFETFFRNDVIAATHIWSNGGIIVDYDILFNTYYPWGDAKYGSHLVMDVQGIATHETGHGLGLKDVTSSACDSVTMYGYTSLGEIDKRTITSADIAGLRAIYGN